MRLTGRTPGSRTAGAGFGATALVAVVAALACAHLPGSPLAAERAAAASADDRYTLAGGCFALRSARTGAHVVKAGAGYEATAALSGAEPFRMQATDLGRYLLYGQAEDFLARNLLNAVVSAASPSDGSDWTVTEDAGGFRVSNGFAGRDLAVDAGGALVTVPEGSGGEAGLFAFAAAGGCSTYPEVALNVSGAPAARSPYYVESSGLVEGHMHQMAFEFLGGDAHCGRPWHRFGAPFALVDCPDHQPNGCAAVLENVLYGNPARCHDPVGWPTFADWPDPKSLTHEQSYYRWLERAHRGGLRIFVNLLVENRVLCELYPIKHNSCDEMTSVRLQAQRINELQDYIDAQAGGPGRGFFRIVRDPFEARRVINEGKLAVVLGMEVSEPFGCRVIAEAPQCSSADIAAGVDELHALGVRQLELINKFDNALAGVAGDSGTTGTITNTGNFASTGNFWDLETCHDHLNHDHSPEGLHNVDASLANGLAALLPPGGTLPVYGEQPHCNRRGLSQLGEWAIRRVMSKGMIFDPDHMSVNARNRAMDIVEQADYPGVISSHSWSTDNALPRIYRLGGMITPYAGGSEGFVEQWRRLREHSKHQSQYFGVGYGADMNGFGSQGGPRGGANPVTYPFESFDGSAVIDRQVSGQRSFDVNSDGVAHYGLYPDWVEDLRRIAGDEIVRDLGRGSEAYLQMWERAAGVPEAGCRARPGRIRRGGLKGLRLGADPRQTLFAAGQPQVRARAWRWCGVQPRKQRAAGPGADASAKPGRAPVVAVFDRSARVGLVLSKLRGSRAAGVAPGDPAGALRGKAKRLRGKIWVRPARGGRRFIYSLRGGRVSYVGVAARSLRKPKRLRSHLALAKLK